MQQNMESPFYCSILVLRSRNLTAVKSTPRFPIPYLFSRTVLL